MKIAIFASSFYPHIGGVEELVRQLAHCYQRMGHECIVLTNRWPRSLPRREHYEGIPLYRLPFRVPEKGAKARLSYCLTHHSVRRCTIRILRQYGAEVLHVQCVSSNGYYALLARRATGLPLVVTAQGELTMDAEGLYQRSMFANRVLRELLVEADWVTACSRHSLDEIERFYGTSLCGRGGVVYNGIRLADFDGISPMCRARPYVLAVGRLVSQKGFDVLIRAFARADIRTHDLVIAGDGPERQALGNLARDLGLSERIVLAGRADRPTILAMFKGCAFFVLPSRTEPLGIVNLEAMAASKAVIASRVGGVPEIVAEGETALLVPPADAAELAAAISRLVADAELRNRLGTAGRRHVERFDWATIAAGYLDGYQHLRARPAAAPHAPNLSQVHSESHGGSTVRKEGATAARRPE